MSREVMPPDPFDGDPNDPAREFDALDGESHTIDEQERTELVEDLRDLGVYQALLEPRGIRGVVVECSDCEEPHFHEWSLLRASLQQLLDAGHMRPHEPAFDPNPDDYVTWEYCRGFADGCNAKQSAR